MKTKGGFYISQIKQLQERIFDRLLTERGLTFNGAQGRILFVLWGEEGPLSMSEIGKRTSLANNTLTSVVDRMVEKGFLTRKQNPNNRRQLMIALTEYALTLKAEYEQVSEEMSQLFYKGFTTEEINECEYYLGKLLNNLKCP